MLTGFSHRWVKLWARPCFNYQLGSGTLLAVRKSHPSPRSWLGGPAQPFSMLTLVWCHILFLIINSALRGCALLCQALSCSFTGAVQLQMYLVTGRKKNQKLLSSFVTYQTVSETEMAKAPAVGWLRIPFGKEIPTQFSASEKTLTVPNIVNISTWWGKKLELLSEADGFVASLFLINKKVWFPL